MASVHKRRWWPWLRELIPLAGLLLMVGSLRSAVADWNQVPTGSMKPTIIEGDRIFVNKLAYDLKIPFTSTRIARWGRPQRGDIVVFFSPEDGTRLVKRIVGVPGDQIELRDNRLVVNGLEASYAALDDELDADLEEVREGLHQVTMESVAGVHHAVMTRVGMSAWGNFGPAIIPAGHYFAMGDNRDNSADSRVFGFVAEDLIVGRATAVVVSIPPEGEEVLRWDRLLESLH